MMLVLYLGPLGSLLPVGLVTHPPGTVGVSAHSFKLQFSPEASPWTTEATSQRF